MRSLIIYLLLSVSLAHTATIESTFTYNQSPPINFTPTTQVGAFNTYLLSIGLSDYVVASNFKFSQSLSSQYFDKAQYRYLDQNQKDLHPKGTNAIEVGGSSTLSYQKGAYSSRIGLSYPLADNYLKKYGVDTSHEVDFFNKSTILGVQYKYLVEKRPENYFLDFDFLVKKRIDTVNAHEISIFYEQVLSESLKLRFRPLSILRPEERPLAYGGEILASYAPSYSHFLKAKAAFLEENRTQLKNERGYFKYLSLSGAWDYEINYKNLVGLYYAYQKESEDNPRNLSKRSLGLDIIGATYERKISSYTLRGDVEYARTNLKSNFLNFSLSIKKEL